MRYVPTLFFPDFFFHFLCVLGMNGFSSAMEKICGEREKIVSFAFFLGCCFRTL